MHQQAQLRLEKAKVEKLGAQAYVVLATDLYRTKVFREQNLLLSRDAVIDTARPPASTAVQVAALFAPGYLVEVEAWALVDD